MAVTIPKQYDPGGASNVPVMMAHFSESNGMDSAVLKVYEKAAEILERILNRSRDENDGTVGSGYRALNQSAGKFIQLLKQKEKKEKDLRFALKLALKDMIEGLDQEIAQHKRNIAVADEFIADLKDGKIPELDDDGSLKNKERERLIQEFEKRTGQTVDRTNTDQLLLITQQQREYEQHQFDTKTILREDTAELSRNLDNATSPEEAKQLLEGYSTKYSQTAIGDLESQAQKNMATAALGKDDEAVQRFAALDVKQHDALNKDVQAADYDSNLEVDGLFGAVPPFQDTENLSETFAKAHDHQQGPAQQSQTLVAGITTQQVLTNG